MHACMYKWSSSALAYMYMHRLALCLRRTRAAVCIQRHTRGLVARGCYQKFRRAVVATQAVFRGRQARKVRVPLISSIFCFPFFNILFSIFPVSSSPPSFPFNFPSPPFLHFTLFPSPSPSFHPLLPPPPYPLPSPPLLPLPCLSHSLSLNSCISVYCVTRER